MPRVNLFPLRGFISGKRRQEVPVTALVEPSLDWLVAHSRYRRRLGSSTLLSGMLESKWGALARRIIAATLRSVTDGFSSPAVLFKNDATNSACVAYRSSNDSLWHTVGDGFSGTTYPNTGPVKHRVVPMVYENEYGGLTMHRLNTTEYRQHAAAGSRNILQVGDEVCWPGGKSAPTRWRDGANGECEVYPIGLVPPLMMPTVSIGADTATTPSAWRGSDAFYVGILFENSRGELSMFTFPRPTGSAWAGYEGFGYVHVDATNPTTYYSSIGLSNIPEGPPGTLWKWIVRSAKVDISTTGPGAIVQPCEDDFQLVERIPQGKTSYVMSNGNDLSLVPDFRIQEMFRSGGIQWPPRASDMDQFDGRITLGNLSPNNYALIVSPWNNGERNLPADSSSLAGATSYFVSVKRDGGVGTKDVLVLRSVTAGTAVDKSIAIAGKSLLDIVDMTTSDSSISTITVSACTNVLGHNIIYRNTYFTTVSVGDIVAMPGIFPEGTKVVSLFLIYSIVVDRNAIGQSPAFPTGEPYTFTRQTSSSDRQWAAQVVPGANMLESCDSLLRTCVATTGAWGAADATIDVTAADAPFITPGMLVSHTSFTAGTVVTGVDVPNHIVTVSPPSVSATGSGGTITFGYDTGDTTLGKSIGFVRTFANSLFMVCPWNKAYLDKFPKSTQDTIYTAGTPGYAHGGVNTWFLRNRKGLSQAQLGAHMGTADLGPVQAQFYARGRMLLHNPRTGLTRADEDYTKSMASWYRGARSPYAICSGSGWAIYLSDEGFFACEAGLGESLLSRALYDSEAPLGTRGALEYAILACIVASDSGTDDYKIHAHVDGGVLYVRYWSGEAAGYPDREVRYDFSAGVGRTGVAEVLMPDNRPYPWSAPLTLRHSCSIKMSQSDGLIHHFACVDSNAGATDGVFREIDLGLLDDGVPVRPVGYTGIEMPEDMNEVMPNIIYANVYSPGGGTSLALTREPEVYPSDAKWDRVNFDSTGGDEFGRLVKWLEPDKTLRRSAIAARIMDDGSGPCAEITAIQIDGAAVKSTTSTRSRP